jgi:hypothetical protein
MKRNSRGELESVELRPFELIALTIRPDDVAVTLQT